MDIQYCDERNPRRKNPRPEYTGTGLHSLTCRDVLFRGAFTKQRAAAKVAKPTTRKQPSDEGIDDGHLPSLLRRRLLRPSPLARVKSAIGSPRAYMLCAASILFCCYLPRKEKKREKNEKNKKRTLVFPAVSIGCRSNRKFCSGRRLLSFSTSPTVLGIPSIGRVPLLCQLSLIFFLSSHPDLVIHCIAQGSCDGFTGALVRQLVYGRNERAATTTSVD